jgi:signal peptidase I
MQACFNIHDGGQWSGPGAFQIIRAMMSLIMWLVVGIAYLSAACSHAEPSPSHLEHTEPVFHDLARRDIANGLLMKALANQADGMAVSKKLQLQDTLASPLTASEQEQFKHSLLQAIKYMLVDIAPEGFLEGHVAAYYAETLSPTEARQALDACHDLDHNPEGRKLRAIRAGFWEDKFPNLVPETRLWSQTFNIPSQAMVPSLLPGDHVIVDKLFYRRASPQRGDVIVFKYPEDETKLFIKRLIGLPGDVIELRDQMVYLNGNLLSEDYVHHTDRNILTANPRDNLNPVTVPSDSYFVLGDNRESSLDSRFWGYVTRDKVVGKAVLIYLSIDRTSKTVRWDRSSLPVR